MLQRKIKQHEKIEREEAAGSEKLVRELLTDEATENKEKGCHRI